jgi:uncharacterized protein with PIN domain
MSPEEHPESGFIVDRMLGTLCRYLRLMGYDTVSANSYAAGDRREDTALLARAHGEERILLTKDRELARRAGDRGVLFLSDDVIAQVRQLAESGLIKIELRMTRCSLCNTPLRSAAPHEVEGAGYAPLDHEGFTFFWCERCARLYWDGSHQKNLEKRIFECLDRTQ